jgi:hypothetical protein
MERQKQRTRDDREVNVEGTKKLKSLAYGILLHYAQQISCGSRPRIAAWFVLFQLSQLYILGGLLISS